MYFTYDDDGMLTCAAASGSCSADDALKQVFNATTGLPQSTKLNLVSTTIGFNDFGELASETATTPSNSTLFSETYDDKASHQRDALGRVLRKTELLNGSQTTSTTCMTPVTASGRCSRAVPRPRLGHTRTGRTAIERA